MVDSGSLSFYERQQHVPELLRDGTWYLCNHYLLPWLHHHQWSDISTGQLWVRWTMVTYKYYMSTYVFIVTMFTKDSTVHMIKLEH